MKKNILILISFCFILTSCSLSDDTQSNPVVTKNIWHLVAVNGGIAGINEQFSTGTIIWDFDDQSLRLTVENNNTDEGIEDSFDSGVYDYSIENIGDDSYLSIDGNEIGSLNFTQSGLVINQNMMSTGTGADGYVYTFLVEVVVVE